MYIGRRILIKWRWCWWWGQEGGKLFGFFRAQHSAHGTFSRANYSLFAFDPSNSLWWTRSYDGFDFLVAFYANPPDLGLRLCACRQLWAACIVQRTTLEMKLSRTLTWIKECTICGWAINDFLFLLIHCRSTIRRQQDGGRGIVAAGAEEQASSENDVSGNVLSQSSDTWV